MNFDFAQRQDKLNSIQGVDAIAIVPGANMVYFTGLEFHLSERPAIALFSDSGMAMITPALEVTKVTNRTDLDARIFSWSDTDGFAGAFKEAARALKLDSATLGVDGATMRVFEFLALQDAGCSTMRDVGQDLLRIRSIKSAEEINAMREAVQLSERALHRLTREIEPGMTERAIATRLNALMQEEGSQGVAFYPLVQTGPNSALPHGMITDRTLKTDEYLLIDFGGMMRDYPADITRTFCYGTPSDEMRRIYDTVLAANQAATAIAAPGVRCGDVDKAARDVIEAAGYGEYFTHRTGHGLGLEGHELPQIAAGVETPLKTGMVFTIEPGIYIPDLGGVRIEDNVAVTENGVDVLTSYPRELNLR